MVTKILNKNLMVMKNIESEYIEEAYIILKSVPCVERSEKDITREATKIIGFCMKKIPSEKLRLPPLFWLSAGSAVTAAVISLVFILL